MRKSGFSFEDILSDRDTSEDLLELPLAPHIFRAVRVLSCIVVFAVLFQVVKIGVFEHQAYGRRASQNIKNLRVVQAERGTVRDRFGKPLTQNEKSFRVFLIPKELPEDSAERERVLREISEFFHSDLDSLRSLVAKKKQFYDDKILLAEDLKDDSLVSISTLSLTGVFLEEGFRRTHSKPFVFSHLIGYTGFLSDGELQNTEESMEDDQIGKTGLEKYYDEYLRGENGVQADVRDSLGRVVDTRVVDLPRKGNYLETYIDGEFQEYFYNRLQEELVRLGRRVGVGIALNPSNGEVLALFGVPGFNTDEIATYLNDRDKTLFTRAVSGLYNPASTIKPLHATAALYEGVIRPEAKIFSAGYLEVPNPFFPANPSIFKDWRAHGWVDVRSALARSSNVYFYEIGGGFQAQAGLGIARLKKWWQEFRLDKKTGIDLPQEETGFLPDPSWKKRVAGRNWLLGDTYNVSIGQGDLLITPIELLSYISSIAARGKFYQPRIMKQIHTAEGRVVEESSPIVIKDLGEEIKDTLYYVEQGMLDGVREPYGTSYALRDIPMTIAGKTGSAQVQNNSKTNAFFVGYGRVPLRMDSTISPQAYESSESTNTSEDESAKPEIAILILVEDAKEGSLNVVPVARDVFLWYYEHRIKTSDN